MSYVFWRVPSSIKLQITTGKKVQSSGRQFKFCLKKHSACFLIWAGVKVLRTLAISMQLFPYFSYSCINILCSSFVHLPLFILQSSGKLIGTKINTESEYNSNLQIGMELSIN